MVRNWSGSLLFILIAAVVLAAGVASPAVYGLDEKEFRMLTPEEQAFHGKLAKQSASIGNQLGTYETMIDYINRGWKDIEAAYIGFPKAPDCRIEDSPTVFEEVKTTWNSEICPAYAALGSKIYSCLGDAAAENPDWTITRSRCKDCLNKLKPECEQLRKRVWAVYDRSRDIVDELVEKRKEAREQAKPLLEEAKGLLEKVAGAGKDKDRNAKPGQDEGSTDSGCFIATAAYGSPAVAQIDVLRRFRDEFLVHSCPGKAFVALYYTTSPLVADFISKHEILRFIVREGFVDHLVVLVDLTERWWAE